MCGFAGQWAVRSRRRLIATILTWFISVAVFIAHLRLNETLTSPSAVPAALSGISFIIVSGMFCVITFGILHVLVCLELMVDNFCVGFFLAPDPEEGVRAWNVLQALLGRSGVLIETTFLTVQTTALLVGVHVAIQIGEFVYSVIMNHAAITSIDIASQVTFTVAHLLLAALAPALLVKGAKVTDKCERAPPLLNSLKMEESSDLDQDRQYLVQYIINSTSGFYVMGNRITSSIVMKMTYFGGTVLFGLTTTLVSSLMRRP